MPETTPTLRHFAILPAAGIGSRLGAPHPKQYLELDGRTVLERSVGPFLAADWVSAVVVVVAPGDAVAAGLPGLHHERLHLLEAGGATRRLTVLAGLRWLAERMQAQADDWTYVHDAARPGLDTATLARLHAALENERVGALLAVRVADTVKRDPTRRVDATLERDGLWLAQTPQAFRHGALLRALERHHRVTDEASAIEATGHRPALVEGSPRNFKITTAEDLEMMQALLCGGGRA
jgi:2-C-methyl-D-erythritol 4-phosphate cytidylyltransferase